MTNIALRCWFAVCAASVLTSQDVAATSICPEGCRCTASTSGGVSSSGVVTDCSHRGLTTWPGAFDPRIVTLNLNGNQLRAIPMNAFEHYVNLSHIDLSDNRLQVVSKRTFLGLKNVKTINLTRNEVKKISRYAFTELRAHADCAKLESHCMLDIRFNDIGVIEEYAFNMVQGLEIMIGHSRSSLTVQPYAFYGARDIRELAITDIDPLLTLEPRVFTNTETIHTITIANVNLAPIRSFAFEGLKSVSALQFYNCHLPDIESYGFSGIYYTPSSVLVIVNGGSAGTGSYQHDGGDPALLARHQGSGGVLNITSCRIDRLSGDLFRDTNLGQINLQNNAIGRLEPYIFRGMTMPQNISMVGNSMEELRSHSLGSLVGLRQFHMADNDLGRLPASVFAGNKEIEVFTLQVRSSSNLTLSAGTFDGVFDVTRLEIRGDGHSHLVMPGEAFRGMFGVADMVFVKVNIPRLTAESFKGLRKVQKITFISCNIAQFGAEPSRLYDSMAGIIAIDMSVGNRLTCDCATTRVLRELNSFMHYDVSCVTPEGGRLALTPDVPAPECRDSGASGLLPSLLPALLSSLLCVVHLYSS